MSEYKDNQANLSKILAIAISIITIAIGWLFVANFALSARVDSMSNTYTEIKESLATIRNDVSWLKNNPK